MLIPAAKALGCSVFDLLGDRNVGANLEWWVAVGQAWNTFEVESQELANRPSA